MNDLITVITTLIVQSALLLIALDAVFVAISFIGAMFNHDHVD